MPFNNKLTTNYKNYLQENLQSIYRQSLKIVRRKTALNYRFPEYCPYTMERVIEKD